MCGNGFVCVFWGELDARVPSLSVGRGMVTSAQEARNEGLRAACQQLTKQAATLALEEAEAARGLAAAKAEHDAIQQQVRSSDAAHVPTTRRLHRRQSSSRALLLALTM